MVSSSYLLVVDKTTRYTWIFPTKSKKPPVEIIRLFLSKYGHEDGGLIRVDQGGELARCTEWRTMVLKEHRYVVEPTGADSPSQNGQAERYNETIATITRTLLYGADLTAQYWSAAAVHAVYLMNRRPHSAIGRTPYEAWWDTKPDLSSLKVFGSRVCVKVTGKRKSKLNRHDFTGIFIGYTATDDNIRYIDVQSGVVKASHHAVFDEACEAPAPKQGFYIQPDRAFSEWWIHQGREPIPDGYVIPVLRAMQGHPESPRLWEKWCDQMIKTHKFAPTTHEPCLYTGLWQGEKCYFKRQVDDFEFAAPSIELAHMFYDALDDHLSMPIKRQGLVSLFNGIDVQQTRTYIKISAETYIEKMGAKYLELWHKEIPLMAERPLPIPTHETFMKTFHQAVGDNDPKTLATLQTRFHFGYRNGVGELIYAMVTCRPDISTVTVKCAQHSANPAEIHFQAVKHAIKYLVATRKDGIYFWRATPRMDLPEQPVPLCATSLHGPLPPDVHRPDHDCLQLHAYTDSDWATCTKTRRSFTGIIVQLAGGTIAYKTKLQPTVALSSTEAEFMVACDTGKMILFIRSILWDLGIPQQAATILYEDNDACTAMANAQKPTTRTRHMDIRYFALADWVEHDLMVLERIHTSINLADHMTKGKGGLCQQCQKMIYHS
eukprot:CCRYP_001671-RA/>CCRYP_001671-RA protein AED:0.29 eAED:-0.05 QI:0/0/0/0.33/1/1/3/0/660